MLSVSNIARDKANAHGNQSIWLLYFVNAFQSTILSNLLPYATSDFESHSLLNVIYVVAGSMSAATYMPLSKVMDVWGRAEGFLIMTVFATLGLILMAASNGIATFCAAYVRLVSLHDKCRELMSLTQILTDYLSRFFIALALEA